jgi:carbon starvation protein
MLNDQNVTPSERLNDGKEYVPTNKWIVFGHHFAAIAGAGPLIGPVLAAQWGWGPGFVWILIGSVFAGAVHDFIILFASMRHNGQSLAVIARRELGPVIGITTSIAIFFIIIVALAGLSVVVVNALFHNPWGTYTIAMTIPIAVLIGLYMFRLRPGAIGSGSLIGFILLLLAVFTGHYIPGSPVAHWFDFTKQEMSLILPIYGFFAAVLPVWLLLAPRDYLSSYMKIGTVVALALGIFIVQPQINAPMTQFMSGGPIINGPWWPYVFITIACGAISGFHSLIGSGTTPKMLQREGEARLVAFGSMLMEGFVAIMALISAVVLMPADYFAINTPKAVFDTLGMTPVELDHLAALVGMDIAHRPGGAVSLAVGMAHIFSSIGGMNHMMSYWYQFAIMFEALFILTTIDAGTRVGRYIMQDIVGTYLYKPMKDTTWLPGNLFCSAFVTVAWGYLVYSGDISSIWPMFGVANQLLAVLALAIGTTILLKICVKKSYALITFAPLCFLAVTVLTAGTLNTQRFFNSYFATGNINALISGSLSVILITLIIITLVVSVKAWMDLLKTDKPVGMNTEIKDFTK